MSFRSTVKAMTKIMDEMGLTELDLERQFLFGIYRKHIHLSRQGAAVITSPTLAAAPIIASPLSKASCDVSENPAACIANAVRSPMVGVVYLSPEPGARPFTQIGAKIKAGDTVCLIEAMKTFNPVKADKDGVVKEILVQDGQAVEFDTPLVVIE
ncbi:MAG: acetyl-CoA carboxylase biotin carboxyl carrier protein [Alphaproteobacteria bacterium]|nr:acetyl-CoA carboxylase biotin carboxyl carrier protein [Alphaproteobacteria bacterium]